MAVDAGLGELGRNGQLLTRNCGPRVRLSKVFTNLPLIPDKPIDIGVQNFCEECALCAKSEILKGWKILGCANAI
jgi:epoxyqueuosine reductase